MLTTSETVEIARRGGGTRKVPAHRYLDFAAHRQPGDENNLFSRWSVTHLPTGRQVADGFKSLDDAASAMIEIARLRNDWSIVVDDDLTLDLAKNCNEIAERHGGRVRQRKDDLPRLPSLNGYSAHSE